MNSIIYHLEIAAWHCKVNGLLNKFPAYYIDSVVPTTFSKPINAYLIGKNNKLDLIIQPFDDVRQQGKEFYIKGSVKKLFSNEFSGPDQGEIIKPFEFRNLYAASISFDNEIYDYSQLFKKEQPIENKEILLSYAMRLKNLLKEKRGTELFKEFQPKLNDFASAYLMSPKVLYDQFNDFIKNKCFSLGLQLDFAEVQIQLTPWCDGNIWEISILPDDRAFILSEPEQNGDVYEIKVFVTLLNGEIKIIR